MSQTRPIFGAPREWAQDFAIATGVGVFFGIIGPFGSFAGGPMELRIFYWVTNLWIGLVVLSVTTRLSLQMAARLDLPVWFALPAGVAVGVAPLSWVLGLYASRFWPGAHGHVGPLLAWYGQTLAISEPCALGFYLINRRPPFPVATVASPLPGPVPEPPLTPEDRPGGAGFVERLSGRIGRELLCLQMEDHYVRAHTAAGSELILMPLKAAIAELGQVEGLQVHRSWWVARAAVSEVLWDGRSARLRLRNGLEAPVSRASLAGLRAAGWLGVEAPGAEAD